MTPHQIALVQQTFDRIAPREAQVAVLFYGRLFSIDPSTRPMFPDDMTAQSGKVMAAIGAVVQSLTDLDAILEPVRKLAVRHVLYGVQEAHYASVGAALLWALEHMLGDGFTREVRDAWAAAYEFLSHTMIEAARRVPALTP